MKTVWAVTHGDYSDYMVLCLFETEELAKQYCEALWAADDKRTEKEELSFRVFGRREDVSYSGLRIESFQLWDAVPVVDIPDWGGRDGLTNNGEPIQ